MDAIQFLKKDHEKVKKTFSKISKGNFLTKLTKPNYSDATRRRMFAALCRELIVHEQMEQKVWYPVIKIDIKVKPIIKHLVSEEKSAAKKIKTFKSIKTQETWEKKFEQFRDDVLHHAKDEEKKLFPVVQDLIDEKILRQIGKKMQAYKKLHLKK